MFQTLPSSSSPLLLEVLVYTHTVSLAARVTGLLFNAGVFQLPSQFPKKLPLSIGFILLQLSHLGRCHVENTIKANTDTAGNVLGRAKALLCSLPEALLSVSIPLLSLFWAQIFHPVIILLNMLSSKIDFACF